MTAPVHAAVYAVRTARVDWLWPAEIQASGWSTQANEPLLHLAACRPHPWAPNKPPLNLVVNAAVSPVDFIRDMVRFEAAPPL